MIFEDALQYFTLYGYGPSLPVEIVILEMSLAELLLIHVVAEAVKLVKAILINHLSSKC